MKLILFLVLSFCSVTYAGWFSRVESPGKPLDLSVLHNQEPWHINTTKASDGDFTSPQQKLQETLMTNQLILTPSTYQLHNLVPVHYKIFTSEVTQKIIDRVYVNIFSTPLGLDLCKLSGGVTEDLVRIFGISKNLANGLSSRCSSPDKGFRNFRYPQQYAIILIPNDEDSVGSVFFSVSGC